MAGLIGGAPGRRRIFENLQKKSLRKLQKCSILPYFAKNAKLCIKFSRVWTKNTIGWGNFEKILKISDENSIEKYNFLSISVKIRS